LTSSGDNLSLGEAAGRFLTSLPVEDRGTNQQEIYKFVRWYGWERPFTRLTAPEIANYAERLSQSDTDYLKKLELIRAFLIYARKEGWRRDNLAVHLKARKGKTKVTASVRRSRLEPFKLTQQGYDELKAELATLQSRRPQIIDDMRRAAADKDFRENAPLDAAKEQRGQLEGRIMELEEILSSAVIIDEKRKDTPRVNIGDSIILQDLASGEELHYTLVSPREVDATGGKISGASPIGKAAIGKGQGEVVEVDVPAGKLRYQIKQIER
jgi:transcription elongation factor GreA